jgi:hypothetical protein
VNGEPVMVTCRCLIGATLADLDYQRADAGLE